MEILYISCTRNLVKKTETFTYHFDLEVTHPFGIRRQPFSLSQSFVYGTAMDYYKYNFTHIPLTIQTNLKEYEENGCRCIDFYITDKNGIDGPVQTMKIQEVNGPKA